MTTLDLGSSYSLTFQTDPFSFAIHRNNDSILRLAPINAKVLSTLSDGPRVEIEFERARLFITAEDGGVSVRWEGDVTNAFPLDGRWYGQGELINQPWPLNHIMLPEADLRTIDNGPTGLSCILAPLWISEHGGAIIAHSPARVGLNAPPDSAGREWSLGADQAPFKDRPALDPGHVGDGLLTLSGDNLTYQILPAANIVEAHRAAIARLGHCQSAPPLDVIRQPIWNTWARHHAQIDEDKVLSYAGEIAAHGYPAGRFVIDDRWQVHYGDLSFDPARFPDPRRMIARLHRMGFTVHTWVVPFFSPDGESFRDGARHGYLVRGADGLPKLVRWWQGLGGLLDVTNPAALAWFLGSLRALQAATGLDGFKFDAGESCFLPADASTHEPIDPNDFTHRYITFVGDHFPWSDVRSGWLNQSSPLLFRQWDKASTWGLDNGLHSVVTGGLSLSVSGYPFFLPDMIGGNAYVEQPDAELMIRWAQANALMPGMQFSLAPWDYGDLASRLCRDALRLHEEFSPLIEKLAQESASTGVPIIRPIFWLDPHNPAALSCDDQFLLGDSYLAAPVVTPGARHRDIILPPGHWVDHWTNQPHTGPTTLHNHPAPLERLPLFRSASAIP